MALRGTLTGISGRRVFFKADDAGKDDKPQEFRLSGDGAPKVLKATGKMREVKAGKGKSGGEAPEYEPIHASALKNGMAIRLMGPPNADLHSIVVLPDDEQPKEQQRSAKATHKAPAQGISEDLEQHTNEELREMAKSEGIALHGASTKDEMVREIKKARRQNKATTQR